MTAPRSLAANYLSLLTGTVGAKILSLVIVLMLSRALGVEGFGRYSLVFSFWALLNTMVDLGASVLLQLEVAKHVENPRPSLESVIYLRLLGCLAFAPLAFILGPTLGLTTVDLLLVTIGLLTAFETFFDVYFTGISRLDLSARTRFLATLWNVALIAGAVLMKAPLQAILAIAFLNPLLKFLLDARVSLPFAWRLSPPDWAHVRALLRNAWPLWWMGLLYILMARIDVFMLEMLSPTGAFDIGIYSAAFRVSEVMALLVNALSPAMLPLLVHAKADDGRVQFLAGTCMRLVLTVVGVLSLGIFWGAPFGLLLAYGPAYAASIDCLQVLIWSQAFVAVNSLCYMAMMIYNAQGKRPVLLSGVIIVLVNIGLNLVLIPAQKAVGAAWATLITEAVGVGMAVFFLHRYTPLRLRRDVILFTGLMLGSLGFGATIADAGGGAWAGFAASALSFVLPVFAFRLLGRAQIMELVHARRSEVPPTSPTTPESAPRPEN